MLSKVSLAGLFLPPAVAFAQPIQGQPIQGLYVGADVAANFAGTLSSSHDTTKIYPDPGPLGIIDLGWGFGNRLRTDIEGSFRSNRITGVSTLRSNGLTLPLSDVTGNAQTHAVMANILYDIPFHPFGSPLTPYVGAGAGYGWENPSNAGGDENVGIHRTQLNYNGPGAASYGSAGAFAYQAMAGASMPVAGLPGLKATLQ